MCGAFARWLARTAPTSLARERDPRDSSRVRQSARRVDPAASDPRDEEPGTLTAAMHNAYGAPDANDNSRGAQLAAEFNRRLQTVLDRSVPHIKERWGVWCAVAFVYLIRISFLHGWYIVTYGLGIYNLNLVIGFLSPQVDPATEGPTLPTKGNEEFKPFVRRLPEFKFWYRSVKSFCVAFCMTFFSVFDVPVFWPILLMYWFMLFFMTMKQQIKHMIKHKYVPISWGKKQYGGKGTGGLDAASAPVKDSK